MEDVEKILQENNIEPDLIESTEVNPEESRRNYTIESGPATYYLSFPLSRDVPVDLRSVEQKVNAEVYSLNNIRDKTSLRAPQVTDYSKEYILVEEIEGEKTIERFKNLNEENQKTAAEKIGTALSEIHSISQTEIGYFNDSGVGETFESWRKFFQPLIDDVVENAESDLESRAARYLENNIGVINIEISPVLVHGDFQPRNTISKEDENLGVIDLESSFSGHREYDLAQATVAWSDKFGATESFLDGYDTTTNLEEGWRERHDYYRVYLLTSAMMNAREIGWINLVDEFEERLDKTLRGLT